jgi:hypothetical protein
MKVRSIGWELRPHNTKPGPYFEITCHCSRPDREDGLQAILCDQSTFSGREDEKRAAFEIAKKMISRVSVGRG